MFDRRKLLEFAAKAAGKQLVYCEAWRGMAKYDEHEKFYDYDTYWNPLRNDREAFLLMVDCHIEVVFGYKSITVRHASGFKIIRTFDGDPYAAFRLAIVRAAAEIGKMM